MVSSLDSASSWQLLLASACQIEHRSLWFFLELLAAVPSSACEGSPASDSTPAAFLPCVCDRVVMAKDEGLWIPYKLNTMQQQIGKRDDDRSTKKDCSWFMAIEKHAVLTEVRGFGDHHFDKTRCLQSEAVAILSSAVNLYRFQDVHLRRMFHLIARDLCPIADERDPRMAITLGQVYPESTVSDKGKHVQFHAMYLEFMMGQLRRERCIAMKLSDIYFRYITCRHVSGRFIPECYIIGHSCWSSSPLGPCILARSITKGPPFYVMDIVRYKCMLSCAHDKDEMVAIEGFRSLARVVGIGIPELKAAIDVMRGILRVSHRPVLRFSAFRALQKVGMAHNVVWTTPEDHIAIGLDVNVYNLYNHRDNEPEAEQVSQVIKSQSFAVKESFNPSLQP
ncbi:hypothetical protein SASPL_152100 [Salvia splendens]|uniref:Uncharacterized protein n=2 Tax=Salvia splendens TaxID=180675 RepID=A0A8X8W2N0_SALSN|nr:hypothetical protein SASPL_152100 [Salvia splendens]